MRIKLLLLCLLSAVRAKALKTEMLVIPKGSPVASVAGGGGLGLEVVSEQAMVRISSGSNARATLTASGYGIATEFSSIGWTLLSLPAGMRVLDGLIQLKSIPGVLDIAPNMVHAVARQANDPSINTQVSLSQIDAQGAWNYEVGTSCRATVVVIDAGVEGTHPDLQSKIVNSGGIMSQYCAASGVVPCVDTPVPTPAGTCNHATSVAGVAAAASDNGVGIAGVSWGAQILSIKVFDNGSCTVGCDCTTSSAAMIRGINYATSIQNTAEAGKVVINMSLGCPPGSAADCPATCDPTMQAALAAATAAGIPVAIAAGNDGGPVQSPAYCAGTVGGTGIIPVGAVNSSNVLESFSSRGAALAANGVVAPGRSVYTTAGNGSYDNESGTSFSSPHVAGLAALVLSARPTMTAAQVQTAIRAGAETINVASTSQGAGRINAYKTMRVAVKGSLAGFEGQEKPIAFPNPYRTSNIGAVSFSIPPTLQGSMMKIKIYTLDGQIVRELGGLTWDGKNTDGQLVASGTYVFSVTSSAGTGRGRVSVIR